MSSSDTKKFSRRKGQVGETIRVLLWAATLAIIIRSFLVEPFNIPSGSMKPTLLIGDYLFVSKFVYGYSRYSLPLGLVPFPNRLFYSEPERGDVAVFKLPSDPAKDYIKRIIGLPGDRIQMVEGLLHINGEPVKRERIEDYLFADDFGNIQPVPQFLEHLPNGVVHRTLEIQGNAGAKDKTAVFVVPEDHFFMMGDNRDNSSDSRFFPEPFRYVPKENLVGRAEFLFWSKDSKFPFYDVTSIRFSRLLDGVN